MIASRIGLRTGSRQAGLTYVEVLIAIAIIAMALVPAIEALHTVVLGGEVYEASTADQYSALSKMEQVLAEPYSALVLAAAKVPSPDVPSSYSDAPATPVRNLVYLRLYDADNKDGDNDPFTVPDPDLDGDDDPFTNYFGPVWVRVEVEGTVTFVESLSVP